jgi:DNA repair protein RadC
MEPRDRLLKEIIEESDREARVRIPRYKIARDGFITVAAETISAPEIAVGLIRNEIKVQHNHFGSGIEVMVLILLNIDNYPIMTKTVGVGNNRHVQVDPGEVFSLVLSPHFGTHGFVLGHNHPSGNIFLSDDDKKTLKEFFLLGHQLGRPMRDFIIIGDGTEKYYSHRNNNYEL